MKILAKIGGAQLENKDARQALACSIAAATKAGHQVIIVHGGGNQIRSLTAALGIEDSYHEGLRITDAATADAVLMVLGGQVNRVLVASLEHEGVKAVGLTGADGGSFSARKFTPEGTDLGYVGEVDCVKPNLINTVLKSGYAPVIATVAPRAKNSEGGDDHFYNINADQAAAPLARALDCEALLFLTDVTGVQGPNGERISHLDTGDCQKLEDLGTIKGGMIPKVRAALYASKHNPEAMIKIASAKGSNAILEALDTKTGTIFHASESMTEGSQSCG